MPAWLVKLAQWIAQSWIGRMLWSWLVGRVTGAIVEWHTKRALEKERKEKSEAALKEYEKAIEADAPREERRKRAEDVLNSIDE